MIQLLQENIAQSVRAFQSLSPLAAPLQQAADLGIRCLQNGHKLLTCGNGGSAADASHLATEFVVRFLSDRRPYPAISLVDAGSTLTAISNDYSFDQAFARQVQAFAQRGDLLIVFSTSGQSPSIVRALEKAGEIGIESIAFLGRDGGKCKGLPTVELIVPSQSTPIIQQAHELLLHTFCQYVESKLPRA